MSGNGRYIEYLKVGSNEVVLELRIVNLLVESPEGLGIPNTSDNKWLLPRHWDEVNKIVTKAATKHIQHKRYQSETCDESVIEVEGEHVKIAFFFTPFKPALQYILSPYRSNVSNPADALETASWLLTSPYPYMLVAAVAPSCTNSTLHSWPLHLESNKHPAPAIIIDSDEDTDYSDVSKFDSSEPELRALAESDSNHSRSKSVRVDSESDASSVTSLQCRSEFDTECEFLESSQVTGEASRPIQRSARQDNKESCATDGEDDSPENLNYFSQYVTLSKVSKYTGTESRMNIHESDLTYTQALLESQGTPLVLARSGVPTQEVFELDKTTEDADCRGTSSALNREPTMCSTETTAFSAKLVQSKPNRRSGISRRKIVQKSPSIHAMLMRSGSPRESPTPSGSFTSSQFCDTQEITLSVLFPVAEDKNDKKGISRRLMKKSIGYADDAHGGNHDETAVNSRLDESVLGKNRKFGNGNTGGTSETLHSSEEASDIASSSGARDCYKNADSKLDSKKGFRFKSSRLAHKKRDQLSPFEMSVESDNDLGSSYRTKTVEQQSSPPRTTRARRAKQDPTGGMKKQEREGSSRDKASDSSINPTNGVSKKEKKLPSKEKKLKYTNTTKIKNNVGETSDEANDNTVVLLPGALSDSSSLSERSSKARTRARASKSKPLKTKHSKWSEDDSDFTPGKRKKGRKTDRKSDEESKKHESLPSRNERRRREKQELVDSDKTEQNRSNETRYLKHSRSNRAKSEKTGSETLISETKTGKEKSKRRKPADESSESEVGRTTTGESSRSVRRSLRLRLCARCSQDEENCTCVSASAKPAVPKGSNAQKFTMQDLSLEDLDQMFKDNVYYLEEINQGIRSSERRDHYQSGGMLNETLFFALCLCPYSMTQVDHLSALCRAKFCLDLHDRITHFRYITRVLVPDLCTKLFMDRYNMNEQEALTVIDREYIHVSRNHDA